RVEGGAPVAAVVDDAAARHALVDRFAAAGVPLDFEAPSAAPGPLLSALAPLVVLGALGAAWPIERHRRRRASVPPRHAAGPGPRVGFADVAGMDEVKEALAETVEFLKNPARFGRLGGRAPRGVLLTGAPGTGKTLLGRAVATEAGVPFLSVSGSSF